MKRIYFFVVFILFYQAATAQIVLTGTPALNVRSLDSTGAELNAVKDITKNLAKSDSLLIVLSASDTGLKSLTDSNFVKKNVCIVSFLGCDESRLFFSDFMEYFYTEYIKEDNFQSAFFKARTYLFNKYPDSPIIPILRCG